MALRDIHAGASFSPHPRTLPDRQPSALSHPRPAFDLVCLSHLRWHFVYQRPQHLLSRYARAHRVFFIEEPLLTDGEAYLDIQTPEPNLWVVTPYLSEGITDIAAVSFQTRLLADLIRDYGITNYVLWYYTPMAMAFTRHLTPRVTVYDCMDELSAFDGASPIMRQCEAELFARADLVFTGGQSLYEAKRGQHPQVFAFPSSVDVPHFARARYPQQPDPPDQHAIPHPRLGYFGVIDERMDLALLDGLATARPDWHLVMIGPTAKIEDAALPRRPNIHYLGMKAYAELPAYLAGWDVALLPFAINDATRFISPTKTPEYLAAGKPVVSTPIRDVVRPYGEAGVVRIADTTDAFIAAVEEALREDPAARVACADTMLTQMSWDRTWSEMTRHIEDVFVAKRPQITAATSAAAAAATD